MLNKGWWTPAMAILEELIELVGMEYKVTPMILSKSQMYFKPQLKKKKVLFGYKIINIFEKLAGQFH